MKIAQEILIKNVDYLLAVNGNQGRLEQAFDNYSDMSKLQNTMVILKALRKNRVEDRKLDSL